VPPRATSWARLASKTLTTNRSRLRTVVRIQNPSRQKTVVRIQNPNRIRYFPYLGPESWYFYSTSLPKHNFSRHGTNLFKWQSFPFYECVARPRLKCNSSCLFKDDWMSSYKLKIIKAACLILTPPWNSTSSRIFSSRMSGLYSS